jgi:hypothetical protein
MRIHKVVIHKREGAIPFARVLRCEILAMADELADGTWHEIGGGRDILCARHGVGAVWDVLRRADEAVNSLWFWYAGDVAKTFENEIRWARDQIEDQYCEELYPNGKGAERA